MGNHRLYPEARFTAQLPTGVAVLELEQLVRTAVFKSANQLVGYCSVGGIGYTFLAKKGPH